MSQVADKARYYLERSVPQLREWEDHQIFTKDEIRTIVQRRNDFEHRILSPGNTPEDFASYASWEKSLAALVAKRCSRLRIRGSSSAHASQGRILQIYDRGVERHRFCKSLWLEYLGYMRKMKAYKRWRKNMTKLLRLMPTDDDLWVMAARRAADAGDMAGARSMFIRGCRFCVTSGVVWIEYARCEMENLRNALKNNEKKPKALPAAPADEEIIEMADDDEDEMVDEDGVITSYDEAGTELAKTLPEDDTLALQKAKATDGSIPQAIFDIACKQKFFTAGVAESFFAVFGSFADLDVGSSLLQHVLDVVEKLFPASATACAAYVRQPVMAISPLTPDFPRALREFLSRLKSAKNSTSDLAGLQDKIDAWVDEMLAVKEVDSDIRLVLEHTRGIRDG